MIPYTYLATVMSIHDGDSIHVEVDLGFGVWKGSENNVPGVMLRLFGCNAIELKDPGGIEARDNLATILPPGTVVVLSTVKPDKFGGRYDAIVQLPNGTDLVTGLIAGGWAAAWDGNGPKPVPVWPRVVTP